MKNATQFHIRPARPEEAGLFYAQHPEENKRLGAVGCVRMDFGRSGNEFWHTWWPRGPEELNSPAFKAELQQIVGKLREDVLKSRFAMERFCYDHGGKIDGGYVQNYGYIVETEHYRYCLRCNPSPGDYNGYLAVYDLAVQRQNMARDKPLVGRVTYANGDAQEFTDKKIFEVYLAKEDVPNNEAYAKLDLPASLWELWDALDKVRLQTDDILYMEIEDYDAFEYLSPHLDGLDISLIELNDLATLLSVLDEVQEAAFEGLFSMEVQRKVNANGGVITLQDLRDLAVSAKTDCYHVVDAADDAQLGRFYAENEFIPELDGVSNEVFEMLDFAGIGRMMRCSENGVFVGSLYVLRDGELTTAPPVQKALPEKPGYLFRLTLGLHPDIGDARTVTLDLPAAEAELLDAQKQLGVEGWEGVTVIDYDGIIPYAADFTDLPMELEEFNAFTKAARDIPRSEVPKLKALLEQFEVRDIETALFLTEHLADYILTPEISSPQEAALDQLCFIMDREEAVRLIPYVNLYTYGCDLIKVDNATLSPYGLLHRADYQPMLTPMQETQKMEMKMK